MARKVSKKLLEQESGEENFFGDQDYNLWVRLTQAKDVMARAREKELSKYGITAMQAAVLFTTKVIITIEGYATPGKVSRWLIREPHSISRILTRMEKEALVSKTRRPGKKNEVNITLTEKGELAYKQSLKRRSIREILSCLSEEEFQQLDSSLKKILDRGLDYILHTRKVPFP